MTDEKPQPSDGVFGWFPRNPPQSAVGWATIIGVPLGLLAILVAVIAILVAHSDASHDSSDKATISRGASSVTASSGSSLTAGAPAGLKQDGTLAGSYAGRLFRVRTALAYPGPEGGIWIALLPHAASCKTWSFGTPESLYFEIQLDVPPTAVKQIPLGRPFSGAAFWWEMQRNGQSYSDEATNGRVAFSAASTAPGGRLEGQVLVPKAFTADDKSDELSDAFGAIWCG